MRRSFITLFLALTAMTLWANDSEYFLNGDQLIPLQQNRIKVTKEVLTIQLRYDNYADVDVYYEYYNPDSTKTILMGFEASEPYFPAALSAKHPYIKAFNVTLNGINQRYKCSTVFKGCIDERQKIEPINWNEWELYDNEEGEVYGWPIVNKATGKDGDCVYAYYFNATFKKGKNIIRHHYRYKMGESALPYHFIDYLLTPAVRWGNKQIDDFTLVIKTQKKSSSLYISCDDLAKKECITLNGVGTYSLGYSYLFNFTREKYDEEGNLIRNKSAETPYNIKCRLSNGELRLHKKDFKPTAELHIIAIERRHESSDLFSKELEED